MPSCVRLCVFEYSSLKLALPSCTAESDSAAWHQRTRSEHIPFIHFCICAQTCVCRKKCTGNKLLLNIMISIMQIYQGKLKCNTENRKNEKCALTCSTDLHHCCKLNHCSLPPKKTKTFQLVLVALKPSLI